MSSPRSGWHPGLRPALRLAHSATSAWLAGVPASTFGIVVGLAGLANAWREGARDWGLSRAFGEGLFAIAALAFAITAALFALKWSLATAAAREEVEHPVRCCFVGLGGVTALQMAQGALPYSRAIAGVLFAAGSAYTLAFGLWRTGRLWRGGRAPETTTPVLYLPTVAGGFVTAITATSLGLTTWGRLAFGAALLSWLAIESVILHRLYTVLELAPPLRPLLGIQIAPPAVGAMSYLAVSGGHLDLTAEALIGYALLQALLALRMARWIAVQPFTPSWWSFTFGGTALASLLVRLSVSAPGEGFVWPALIAFVAANLAIAALSIFTIRVWAIGAAAARTAGR